MWTSTSSASTARTRTTASRDSAVQPRAVLWDLDGTLADSREHHWRAWREALAADGIAVTEAQFAASFGQRNDAILGEWLGPGANPDRVRRIGEAKEACFRRLVAEEGLVPLRGAVAWIERLAQGGWRQAVASSAPRANVEVVVASLADLPADAFERLVPPE